MSITRNLIGEPFSGIAFTGCSMTEAAPASAHSPPAFAPAHSPAATAAENGHDHDHGHEQVRRREVVVNGKRIKTVDIHAHCAVPAALAVIGQPLDAPGLLMTDTRTRIAAMDAQGIDVEALSINPYWYRADRDAAAQLIRIQNETLVEFCATQPDRFVGFATAALQYPDLAVEQLE